MHGVVVDAAAVARQRLRDELERKVQPPLVDEGSGGQRHHLVSRARERHLIDEVELDSRERHGVVAVRQLADAPPERRRHEVGADRGAGVGLDDSDSRFLGRSADRQHAGRSDGLEQGEERGGDHAVRVIE